MFFMFLDTTCAKRFQENKWKIMFKVPKALRVTVTGLFKLSPGTSATGTKHRDMISCCLDIPKSQPCCFTR